MLRAITRETLDGWAGIDRALADLGASTTGWQLFQDMALALAVNDVSTGYGFHGIELETAVLVVPFEADATSVELDAPAGVSARLALAGDALEVRPLAPGAPLSFGGKRAQALVLTAREPSQVSVLAR